jgi:hypothetical protein
MPLKYPPQSNYYLVFCDVRNIQISLKLLGHIWVPEFQLFGLFERLLRNLQGHQYKKKDHILSPDTNFDNLRLIGKIKKRSDSLSVPNNNKGG